MTTLILTKNIDRIQVFHLIYAYVCVCMCVCVCVYIYICAHIDFVFQMYYMIGGVVIHSPHSVVSVDLFC